MLAYTDMKTEDSYTLEQLKPGIRHFVIQKLPISTGNCTGGIPYYSAKGYEYFETNAGDIELNLWLKLVEEAISDEDKSSLYEDIKVHERKKCYWINDDRELRLHAAQCLCNRIYENWDDFTTSHSA